MGIRTFALVVGVLTVISTLTAAAQRPALPDLSVKAAFVAKFPAFVTWPARERPGATLCLSPAHPFRDLVQRYATRTSVDGRPLTVLQLRPGESAAGCDAVFVASVDHAVLQETVGRPVLTIGDEPGFCERGGLINLRVVDERVRFEINLQGARRVGLMIDAQLLALASQVHGGPR